MKKNTFPIVTISAALAYYWLWPLGRLTFQQKTLATNLKANISSQPNPFIQRIWVLPSYTRVWDGTSSGKMSFRLKPDRNRIGIFGYDFQSPYVYSKSIITATINGKTFAADPIRSDETANNMVELELGGPVLPNQPLEITVTRDGMVSNAYKLSSEDVSHQLHFSQLARPQIVDAIPIAYPIAYGDRDLRVRFLIFGWPKSGELISPESSPYTVNIDNATHEQYNYFNPNILDLRVPLGKTSHEATLISNGIPPQAYRFNTAQFEQRGKNWARTRTDYFAHLPARERPGERTPLILQGKNNSMPPLAMNFIATFVLALLLVPWRTGGLGRWLAVFLAPVVAQMIPGFFGGLWMLNSGPRESMFFGYSLMFASVGNALRPMGESIVVASILTYAVRRFQRE